MGGASTVYMRNTDGAPPVELGAGWFPKLSPDRQWVARLTADPRPRVKLLPAGAGDARTLPPSEIGSAEFVLWTRDSHSLVIAGYKGDNERIYVQAIDGSAPKPISPSNFKIGSNRLTPDGRYVVGRSGAKQCLIALSGSEAETA